MQIDSATANSALERAGLSLAAITDPEGRVPIEKHHLLFLALAEVECQERPGRKGETGRVVART